MIAAYAGLAVIVQLAFCLLVRKGMEEGNSAVIETSIHVRIVGRPKRMSIFIL